MVEDRSVHKQLETLITCFVSGTEVGAGYLTRAGRWLNPRGGSGHLPLGIEMALNTPPRSPTPAFLSIFLESSSTSLRFILARNDGTSTSSREVI